MEKINIFWFRRDLRVPDNCGLYKALSTKNKLLAIFIFDTSILEKLESTYDRRVDYIHQAVQHLSKILQQKGSSVRVFVGRPEKVFSDLISEYKIDTVFCNRDYEPLAIQRDNEIAKLLKANEIEFNSFKDQVIFEGDEIAKADGNPYTVYTPYAKKWKETLQQQDFDIYDTDHGEFVQGEFPLPTLGELGFEKTDITFDREPVLPLDIISNYDKTRDFPSVDGTTNLGIALRFGTISIRKCVEFAVQHNAVWLNELIWREFFMQILYHFPNVEHACFKPKYENIKWRNDEVEFQAWCEGNTGYPIVDAGMRQLNASGQMHNRVRMIVASFLTKHLLIDWRWGEAYFAQKLLDYDLAANNGNWQWAAGCGCDAAPYFRIFNPSEQTKKFDKNLQYINRWNPDYAFRQPIVEHSFARQRALDVYKTSLEQ